MNAMVPANIAAMAERVLRGPNMSPQTLSRKADAP